MYRKKAPCTVALIVVNVAVFIFLSFGGMTEDAYYMLQNGAIYLPLLQQGEYYRLITSIFLHFGFSHLVNNMLMLGVMGWQLELVVGKIKFLIIYFAAGIGGNMLSALVEMRTGDFAVSAGASGAIFGIIGALLYIAVRNHGQIGNVSGQGILVMIALTLYYGFTSSGVDNFAHIGGLAVGFVLAVLLYRKRDTEFRSCIYR
ncbi:rhomboid family intramembrane serine protease [Faecalicatena contorta]|uniref:rhomboid family intramembrane serine protease n=1 Tax=Clostridia TaxID=186801 RepID=UPI00051C95D2|nr:MULTISPECIES: rhomboid family intramembrane serine protease [Clostridia]MBM6685116.1 rhomboid family intramembrane serine protease [Faecalicatena contorta]MBM6710963.1 rhomboid family intramembrane serine protease [Faecalicatena contorta]